MRTTQVNEYIQKLKPLFLHPTVQSIGLNAVRVLSLASLTLVFLSTIVDMDTNVKAMNAFYSSFAKDPHPDRDIVFALLDCEYIELSGFISYCFLLLTEFFRGSSVPNQPAGAFWAFMASLFILFQTIILGRQFPSGQLLTPTNLICTLVSELGWHTSLFDRYFPVLGSYFGLGILGVFQCMSVLRFCLNGPA